MMCGTMWLYALMVVGTTLVGANPMRRTVGNCWPQLTIALDQLSTQITALPENSVFRQQYFYLVNQVERDLNLDLRQEEGRHAFICGLEEVDSVAELYVFLDIHYPIQQFQQEYNTFKMMYPMLGGSDTVLGVIQAMENFLAWSVQNGFPSIPFTGATEDELHGALVAAFNGVRPVMMLAAADLVAMAEPQLRRFAHAFAVSQTADEFADNLGWPAGAEHFLEMAFEIKENHRVYRELLAFDKTLVVELDKHGMFTLPAQ